MDAYYAGWLSIVPPVLAIVLALITKEVFSSLFLGILSGTIIYSIGIGHDFVLIGAIDTAFSTMTNRLDFNIILFCSLLGALVYIINVAGGTRAYGKWATKKIKSKKSAMLSTSGLGGAVFIDDYFNCLTVGTVMRPITDSYKISRAKLAYIIDSTAAPICIIAPISSWAAAVGSNLKATNAFESDFAAFIATIPYNFYAIFCLIMVIIVCLFDFNLKQMRKSEQKAKAGDVGAMTTNVIEPKISDKGTLFDMIIPIIALIVFAVLALLYTGGYFGDDASYHSLGAAFGNASASVALVWASFGAIVVAFFMLVPRQVLSLKSFMDSFVDGVKAMLPANMILVLAWTIGGICRDLLQTPLYVKTLFEAEGGATAGLLPAFIFVIAGFLSFSTGTAWGTFGILIPIVVPIVQVVDPDLIVVSLSATLAGSVFGDHCSPISDTTILSSAGAGCNLVEHVSTQLGYAIIVAVASIASYLVAGFTDASIWLSLGAGLLTMGILVAFFKMTQPKEEK